MVILAFVSGPAAAATTTTTTSNGDQIGDLLDKPDWNESDVQAVVEWVRTHDVEERLSEQQRRQLVHRLSESRDRGVDVSLDAVETVVATVPDISISDVIGGEASPTTTSTQTRTTTTTSDASFRGDSGQTPPQSEIDNNRSDPLPVEYQLSDVTIHNVSFVNDGQTVRIKATWNGPGTVSVTDSGAIQDLNSHSGTGVPYQTYSFDEGTHVVSMDLASNAQVVTIQQGERMYAAAGDRSMIEILQGAPTVALVRWSVIAGAIGSILALGLSVGYLRRRHENTYKELMAEERVRVEEDPVEGILGKISRFVSDHQYLLSGVGLTIFYLTLSMLGIVPGPGDLWESLNDPGRVVLVGSVLMMLISFAPVYALAVRLFEPAKEYIIDLDARDFLDPSLGSNSGLALDADSVEEVANELDDLDDMEVVAVYSGSPDRVTRMRVDGEPAEIRTAGGRGYAVEDFDPKRNAARGTWPGTASDIELLSERSKIDGNREILRDESRMLRRLIGALPAISTASDTSAMQSIDREIRNLVSVDSDPIDNLLDRSAQGTRFEDLYSDDEEGDIGDLVDTDENNDQDDEDGEEDEDGRLKGAKSS